MRCPVHRANLSTPADKLRRRWYLINRTIWCLDEQVNQATYMCVGIDLGGTKVEGVVLDAEQRPLLRRRVATESEQGYLHIVERVGELADELLALASPCRTVGVGTPGAVSSRTGRMKNCNTLCLNGEDLPADLARRLGRQVIVENDANCFTLAEAAAGAGRGASVVFGVIMGTGVGGGIVVGGKLWRGLQNIAGEWGHHCIDPDGPVCYCGRRGCVERYISGPAVEEAYADAAGVRIPLEQIVMRARAGEGHAKTVFARFVDAFGHALASVVTILDPDAIVLGGGLSKIDELYTEGRRAVAQYVFNDELRTPILRPVLGDSAGVIGAALLS
jgi:fructokinase